ncbi:hypothetical protein RJ641_026745, partial [Dillenia turbinata]
VKAPNILDRAKEEIVAILHHEKSSNHENKETHGLRNDIDENTLLDDVKAPNVFERVKEEFEALVQVIHPPKKESDSSPSMLSSMNPGLDFYVMVFCYGGWKSKKKSNLQFLFSIFMENVMKTAKLCDYAGETTDSVMHSKSPTHHHKEIHGLSDDIDEDTPVDAVKGPNVFQRAKEELETLVETIHPRKESDNHGSSPKSKGGFGACFARGLEKVCAPRGSKSP